MNGRSWWREPLVHFLAIGALLFLVFNWRGGGGPASNRIVITPGQIDSMVAGFARTWQRPPTEQELKGLVDDYVREEMATREAMATGLDRDDTVIRRRLRQKLEFMAEDTIDAAPVTDAELQAWIDAHPETFRIEPQISFRQVYLSPDRRGAAVDADARVLLAQLSAAGPSAKIDHAGDALMLPGEVGSSARTDVARQFGEEFADAVLTLEPGRWTGPLRSGYGLHLVFVRERKDGRSPGLAEVRPIVEREFLSDRRKRRLNAMYEQMLARYRVTVEPRAAAPTASDTPAGAAAPGGSK
jgi:PPIC-type PPIASE domain